MITTGTNPCPYQPLHWRPQQPSQPKVNFGRHLSWRRRDSTSGPVPWEVSRPMDLWSGKSKDESDEPSPRMITSTSSSTRKSCAMLKMSLDWRAPTGLDLRSGHRHLLAPILRAGGLPIRMTALSTCHEQLHHRLWRHSL